MRKTILSIIAAASFITASAAVPTLTENWSKSLTGINVSPNYVTPVKTDATGAVIATGTFDTDFEFAKNTLEALGTSSYILKYAADGTPAWGVALTGAATITTVDTDADGNVYVAGIFADEVVFNTTSGEPITKMGMTVDGAAFESPYSSFIAKYSANGKVETVETFIPEKSAGVIEAIETADMTMGFSYYSNLAPEFVIPEIKIIGNKLYSSVLYTGSTKKGNAKFESSCRVEEGWLISDLRNAAIFSLNSSDLQNCNIEASLNVSEKTIVDKPAEEVTSVAFGFAGDELNAAFVGFGTLNLQNGSLNKQLSFKIGIDDEGTTEYGFIVANSQNVYSTYTTTNALIPNNEVRSIIMNNSNLYIPGNYQGTITNGSDNTTSNGQSDIFVINLDPTSMTLKALKTYDFGAKTNYEVISSLAAYGEGLYINFLEYDDDTWDLKGAKSVIFDGTAFTEAPVAATGVSTADKAVAFGQVTAEGVTFSSYTSSVSGITDITTDGGVSVFPNPVVDVLNFSEPVDVIIYSLNGSVVKTASQVSTLNVTDLATGLYIVKAGDKAVRIIKK